MSIVLRLSSIFPICFMMLFSSINARGQQTTGEIVGTITDTSRASIPMAKVTLFNVDTGESKSLQSTGNGDYIFAALQPGNYKLNVSATGFKSFQVNQIKLAAGDHFRANAEMPIGEVDETITVESTASSLQTETSAVNTTLTERAVQDLPLNGRNLINLVVLAPGASEGIPTDAASGFGPSDRRQTSSVSVNGQSEQTNQQLIDGMDNLERFEGEIGVRPSIDSIAEIQVQTNVFTAEVGRTGGGVINVITKSGSNTIHGSLFEFFRNNIFDANPFAFGAHLPQAELRQNQFGGSIGGPIRRDKLFAFADYEELRQIQGTTPTSLTVPTLYEEQHPGDFSDTTGGTVLPASTIDHAGLAYFSLLPAPNNGATTYTGVGKGTYYSRTIDGRVDYQMTPNDRLFARYAYNNIPSLVPAVFPAKTVQGLNLTPEYFGNGPALDRAQNALLSYQHTFTPHLLFEVKASYLFVDLNSKNFNSGLNPNAAFGQPGINISDSTSALAVAFIFGVGTPIGSGGLRLPLESKDNTYELLTSLTYTRGSSTIKIGGSAIRRDVYQNGQTSGEGNFQFPSFLSLLQGKPTTVSRNLNLFASNYRTFETSGYIQDDWHVAATLTLNLGVRYDIFTPYTERQNRLSNFDPVSAKLILADVNGTNSYAGLHNDFSNVAPRVGFSYNPAKQTVVHGGFGLVYYPGLLSTAGVLRNLPYVYTYGPCNEALGTCASGFNQFSAGLPTPTVGDPNNPVGGITGAVDPNFKSTSVAQYNIFFQQEFGANVLSIGYVGLAGRHVLALLPDINVAPPNACGSASTTCYAALRPYYAQLPNVTTILQFQSTATNSYNGLQTSLDRRFTKSLAFGGTYTWAHDLDEGSPVGGQATATGAIPSVYHTLDRGNASFDIRNRITARANYALPYGKNLHGIFGVLAKGWQTNLLYVWSTGVPFSVVNSTSVSDTVTTDVDRPNQISNQLTVSNPTISQYFNTSAFVKQAVGTYGNERRNQIYGPRYRHLDISVFKTFPITDKSRLEFRVEGFNVTNTANFSNPTPTLQSVNFGKITSLQPGYNPRLIQFAAKFAF